MGVTRLFTVLVVNQSLAWNRNEGAEIRQAVVGLVPAVEACGGRVLATDGRALFAVTRDGDDVAFRREGGFAALLRADVSVAHVHLVNKPAHAVVAALCRLRHIPVVCSPMAMLGRDFAAGSWFHDPRRPAGRTKPLLVAALRLLWRRLAVWFVCTSEQERRQARLPADRTLLLPLPLGDSAVAAAADASGPGATATPHGPLALVSRFDVHRKGIDRVCAWLLRHADQLPRPAVRLFAPADPAGEAVVGPARDAGLLEWDTTTSGAKLAPALRSCRGLVLLSRYEGQPRVLREAALLGLPVVTTAAANFSEAVAALGVGVVVDGDDADAVQAAFEALAQQRGDPSRAAALFDRDRIGAFLAARLAEVATGGPVGERSCYALANKRRPSAGAPAAQR